MTMPLILMAVGLLLGFAGGLVTFKRSLRWCRECGTTLTCPVCSARRPAARTTTGRSGASVGAAR